MSRKLTTLAAVTVMSLFLLTGSASGGTCNWEVEALAGIGNGGEGIVKSSHFGKITRVDCINSRKTALQHRTLKNSSEVSGDYIIGPSATLGAHIGPEDFDFGSCSGQWSSTTKFGTSYLGVRVWYGQDVSGIYYANCDNSDPPDEEHDDGGDCNCC